MAWMRACDLEDVPPDGAIPVDIKQKRMMVVRCGDSVYAADRTCSHADADLSNGFVSEQGVRCPLHLSVFEMPSGNPLNPPAHEPITTYNVKIERGAVLVEV